jgi:predicted ABC-type ATPase
MRVFAGPNGSGKTTIVKQVKEIIPFGVYINADDIEQQIKAGRVLLFDQYHLKISEEEIHSFFKKSTFSPIKRKELDLWKRLKVTKNILKVKGEIDSYLCADIAEFIRQKLLINQTSFTYETVMSHENKITFLEEAKKSGYKVYLYYVATEDPEINISRVKIRVAQNGHPVPAETIKNRYFKSLKLLKKAIKSTDRAYIFDNSGQKAELIAEITDGSNVKVAQPKDTPNWFVKYVYE